MSAAGEITPSVEAGQRLAEHGVLNNQGVVVAETLGVIIGFSLWVWIDLDMTGQVTTLGTWVHPDYRRTGITKRMDAVARTQCKAQGRTHAIMGTGVNNRAGTAMCRARGGVEVARQYRLDL